MSHSTDADRCSTEHGRARYRSCVMRPDSNPDLPRHNASCPLPNRLSNLGRIPRSRRPSTVFELAPRSTSPGNGLRRQLRGLFTASGVSRSSSSARVPAARLRERRCWESSHVSTQSRQVNPVHQRSRRQMMIDIRGIGVRPLLARRHDLRNPVRAQARPLRAAISTTLITPRISADSAIRHLTRLTSAETPVVARERGRSCRRESRCCSLVRLHMHDHGLHLWQSAVNGPGHRATEGMRAAHELQRREQRVRQNSNPRRSLAARQCVEIDSLRHRTERTP